MKRYYRQNPSSKGLKNIENKTLVKYTPDFYSNLNTGVLEEYLDEENKKYFDPKEFSLKTVVLAMIIGSVFVFINSYVGLKIGMMVSGSWYLIYILCMAFKWSDKRIMIAETISTSIGYMCTGFVFIFPAIYILQEQKFFSVNTDKTLIVAVFASIILSFLGVFYSLLLRRIWIVEDPLPLPGFEANLTLLDIAHNVYSDTAKKARRMMKKILSAFVFSFSFVFLRDFPLINKNSVFDHLFKSSEYYEKGSIIQPKKYSGFGRYVWADFYLSPLMVAVGWFMRLKGALILCLGTILTWFVINPVAVYLSISAYNPNLGKNVVVSNPVIACSDVARIIAIGAILGSGVTALIKILPKLKSMTLPKTKKISSPELSIKYVKPITLIAFVFVSVIFILAGYPIIPSIIVSFIVVTLCFLLGLIAIKVMGEVGSMPVSGMSFIVVIVLIGFLAVLGLPLESIALISLIATTAFAGGVSMAGNMIWDFKTGLYIGNKPKNLVKAQLIGIIPGAVIAGMVAYLLCSHITEMGLLAPQANAFAALTNAILGFHIDYRLLLIGLVIGIIMEIITGRGTAFSLGMYFPLGITLPILLGGVLRFLWEKRLPKISSEEKSVRLIDSYTICTGLIAGESIMGAIVCIAILT
jgi:putative OPT family oligopeptide transporter